MTKRKFWHIEVPEHLDKQLACCVEKGPYKTKSEFVRGAVRDRLKKEIEGNGQNNEEMRKCQNPGLKCDSS
jgi:Arc/MetJ-type ribon-helix-helix transcriptional regulator